MGRFIIPNNDFSSRVLFIKEIREDSSDNAKEAVLDNTDNEVANQPPTIEGNQIIQSESITLNVEEHITTEESGSFKFFDANGEQIPISEINNKTLETLNIELEAKELSHPRTLAQYKMSQHPSTSPIGVMIDEMLEDTFKSSEAVVASRLSYIRKISDLIHEYDTIVNALLALAESFSVFLPSRKIDHVTQEIMEVNIPVTRNGHFNANEIALITIYLRKKMENFPATAQDLNAQITRLSETLKFKDAQILTLKNRLDELMRQKPVLLEIFVLKRQGRERYLYLDKKQIKSSKVITPECTFHSKEDAERALIYAIKKQGTTTVKKVISYEIVQMIQGPVVTSTKLQEAMKNAYK